MNKERKNQFKKSYESDGIMGKDKKKNPRKKQSNQKDELFFNTTQSSE